MRLKVLLLGSCRSMRDAGRKTKACAGRAEAKPTSNLFGRPNCRIRGRGALFTWAKKGVSGATELTHHFWFVLLEGLTLTLVGVGVGGWLSW